MKEAVAPDAAALLHRLYGAGPTPLLALPRLASRCGVARILVKDEGARPLGNFKTLGGTYAALCALARIARVDDPAALIEGRAACALPTLLCASDGNHGLAVAAAAAWVGASARIYLSRGVASWRVDRIIARRGKIVLVDGTYDDAVAAARHAASCGEGLLIGDTSTVTDDRVVGDVLAGYAAIAREIIVQATDAGYSHPTHLFVQAGVGGLAAAMAEALHSWMVGPRRIVIVEPSTAACVAAALKAGRVTRVAGTLETSASMLSCGEASAPAVAILGQHGASTVAVEEELLERAVTAMSCDGGPSTTASGAAGLAGLLAACDSAELAATLDVEEDSRILLIATERTTGHAPGRWTPPQAGPFL